MKQNNHKDKHVISKKSVYKYNKKIFLVVELKYHFLKFAFNHFINIYILYQFCKEWFKI